MSTSASKAGTEQQSSGDGRNSNNSNSNSGNSGNSGSSYNEGGDFLVLTQKLNFLFSHGREPIVAGGTDIQDKIVWPLARFAFENRVTALDFEVPVVSFGKKATWQGEIASMDGSTISIRLSLPVVSPLWVVSNIEFDACNDSAVTTGIKLAKPDGSELTCATDLSVLVRDAQGVTTAYPKSEG